MCGLHGPSKCHRSHLRPGNSVVICQMGVRRWEGTWDCSQSEWEEVRRLTQDGLSCVWEVYSSGE